MIAFIFRRVLLSVPSMFAISVVTFLVMELPFIRHGWIPVESLPERYWDWIITLYHGNIYPWEVGTGRIIVKLGDRLLMTMILAMSTIVFMWGTAIPIAIYSAMRQRSIGDYTFRFLGFIGMSVPDFMLALVMMYFAFVWFDFPIGGLFSREHANAPWGLAKVGDLAEHLVIPVIVLGTSGMAGLIRIMRANLLDELPKPYVVTARARGMTELRLVLKYPVRLALNPLLSTVGYTLPWLISGTVIVSVVLGLPTVGPPFLTALVNLDMFFAGFIILFLGLLTIVGTLLSDILLAIVDPRVRLETR